MSSGLENNSSSSRSPRFLTTRWSMILAARRTGETEAEAALEDLCRAYWYPLYAFARRRGAKPDAAADLTQGFFARLLEKDFLDAADRERGRFRSFLLTLFKRYCANEHDRGQTQKRGGGVKLLSIDAPAGEEMYRHEPADSITPEALFERRWALTLLGRVMQQLQAEFDRKGKTGLFDKLKHLLVGSPQTEKLQTIADEFEMTGPALRVTVHRLRQRYRELLCDEILQTLDDPSQLEDELNALRAAMTR